MAFGAFTNAWCLYKTQSLHEDVPNSILIPAQVFIAVCGYRCIFPNRYNACVVLHDTMFSSIWITRFLATFSETFWLYQLHCLAMDLNAIRPGGPLLWIDALARVIFFLVCFAQCCVWSSFIFETDILMWYEEANWAVMFVLNSAINLWFLVSGDMFSSTDPRWSCVWLSLVFGVIYLPWQIGGHLPYINSLERQEQRKKERLDVSLRQVKKGCLRALFHRKPTTLAEDWGGSIGAFWMFGYWILEPFWLLYVAYTYSERLRM